MIAVGQWENILRFLAKFLQFAVSLCLIFSLYNIGPYWFLLIATLAVPLYGMHLILTSSRHPANHAVPYIRYRVLIRNRNCMKVDYVICATMCCVCFGFSLILFFGFLKISSANVFILHAALSSLILALLYLLNAFVTAKQIRKASIAFLYGGKQLFTTKASERGLEPTFWKPSHRIAPTYSSENGNFSDFIESPLQRSSPCSDRSLMKGHKESSDSQSTNQSNHFAPALNAEPIDSLWSPSGVKRTGNDNIPQNSYITARKPSSEFGPKISFCSGPLRNEGPLFRKHVPMKKVPAEIHQNNFHETARVIDISINGAQYNYGSLLRFLPYEGAFSGRKKSLPAVLSPASSAYSITYKTNTEPYNRRAVPPNNILKRSESVDELRAYSVSPSESVLPKFTGTYRATPTIVKPHINQTRRSSTLLTHKKQPLGHEISSNYRPFSNAQAANNMPLNFISPSTHSNYDNNGKSIKENCENLRARMIPYHVPATPEDLCRVFTDSANSDSMEHSTTDGSGNEHVSSSMSTVRVGAALSQSPQSINDERILIALNTSKVNVNEDSLLTTIATAIDSARETQIWEKKQRQKRISYGDHCDFDVLIRPKTAPFLQSTELNIIKNNEKISPRQVTNF